MQPRLSSALGIAMACACAFPQGPSRAQTIPAMQGKKKSESVTLGGGPKSIDFRF
ncbi:hypothetical protein QTH97_01275 [Variovorax sp. J22R24]|uniref:hypothetical protein n=1 Tax=Variovorax gracilis TaxID=3053502 RepID=UPI0025766507|nr:hypothetical protein [Variovorax sp. J22R24]MDM0103545.1 hypothetical protein [Variovorax sp. J22R24]